MCGLLLLDFGGGLAGQPFPCENLLAPLLSPDAFSATLIEASWFPSHTFQREML